MQEDNERKGLLEEKWISCRQKNDSDSAESTSPGRLLQICRHKEWTVANRAKSRSRHCQSKLTLKHSLGHCHQKP